MSLVALRSYSPATPSSSHESPLANLYHSRMQPDPTSPSLAAHPTAPPPVLQYVSTSPSIRTSIASTALPPLATPIMSVATSSVASRPRTASTIHNFSPVHGGVRQTRAAHFKGPGAVGWASGHIAWAQQNNGNGCSAHVK